MDDRIMPTTTEADRVAVAARLGLSNAAPVRGGPFRQWVIENDFRNDRPP